MAHNTTAQIPPAAPDSTSAKFGCHAASAPAASAFANPDAFDIVDFRQEELKIDFPADIRTGLAAPDGVQKTLPTLLVYDEPGLQLFQDITYLDEYYLTNAEIAILEAHAARLAREIQPHSIMLELGSGYAPLALTVQMLQD